MKLESNISHIIEQIVEVCTEKSEVSEIILYGSRAKGTHMEKSDIDIALKGDNINIEGLLDRVQQLDTLLKIDLLDLERCKNDLLKKEVEKYGITLYSKV